MLTPIAVVAGANTNPHPSTLVGYESPLVTDAAEAASTATLGTPHTAGAKARVDASSISAWGSAASPRPTPAEAPMPTKAPRGDQTEALTDEELGRMSVTPPPAPTPPTRPAGPVGPAASGKAPRGDQTEALTDEELGRMSVTPPPAPIAPAAPVAAVGPVARGGVGSARADQTEALTDEELGRMSVTPPPAPVVPAAPAPATSIKARVAREPEPASESAASPHEQRATHDGSSPLRWLVVPAAIVVVVVLVYGAIKFGGTPSDATSDETQAESAGAPARTPSAPAASASIGSAAAAAEAAGASPSRGPNAAPAVADAAAASAAAAPNPATPTSGATPTSAATAATATATETQTATSPVAAGVPVPPSAPAGAPPSTFDAARLDQLAPLPAVPARVARLRDASRASRAERIVRGTSRAMIRHLWDAAADDFREALTYVPTSVPAMRGLARCAIEQEHWDVALAWTQRANALEPRDVDTLILRGDAWLGSGNREAARAAWRDAIAIDPRNRDARARMRRRAR